MIRTGTGMLMAAALGAATVAACGDTLEPPPTKSGTGGAAGAGTGGTGNTSGSGNTGGSSDAPKDDNCSAECCPTDGKCYSDESKAKTAPGAACLATRDNTGKNHVSMRQTWIRATAPKGNIGPVYTVLSGRTELPLSTPMMGMSTGLPDCKMNGGVVGYGGYMQLTDLYFANGMNGAVPDYDKDFATTGFSTYVSKTNVLGDLTNGFCMGTQDWVPDKTPTDYTKYALGPGDMSPTTDFATPPKPWAKGLTPPMALKDASGNLTSGWHVTPTKAKRLDKDFDLKTDREMLLGRLASDGELGMKGYGGVFYYDASTGYQHSYGPMGWVIVYNVDGSQHIAIPARESEFKSNANDPARPNCIGLYGQTIDPSTSKPTVTTANKCTNTADSTPPWGGGNCTAATGLVSPDGAHATCKPGEGPYGSSLYFLITELEQIFAADLGKTLCVTYPTADDLAMQANGGFLDSGKVSCKGTAWKPNSPDGSGLPKGDWCAATNSPAHDHCHDAWHSTNFHTFAGTNIQIDPATNLPKTCAF